MNKVETSALISWGCVFGVFSFSVLLFLSGDLLYFWMFLELSGLCLIPCLYLSLQSGLRPWRESKVGVAALTYIIVLSLSSSLLLCGVLDESLIFLLFIGFIVKFGVYPFSNWVVSVLVASRSWLVVLCVSTFFKFPLLVLSYFVNSLEGAYDWANLVNTVYLLCCLTFVYMSWKFITSVRDYYECWTNMMISSSAALYCLALCLSLDWFVSLFLVYLFWSLGVIVFLGYFDSSLNKGVGSLHVFGFCLLLLATPASLALFYKLIIAGSMLSGGYIIFFIWCVNSVVEQWWLMRCLVSLYAASGRSMSRGNLC